MSIPSTFLIRAAALIGFGGLLLAGTSLGSEPYAWIAGSVERRSLAGTIPEPRGYRRVKTRDPFALWLRGLPLKPGRPPVHLYNGARKSNQSAHYRVIDMDVGAKDLQQCADAIMRLRAEFRYGRGEYAKIRFNFTDGVPARYDRWRQGYRPRIRPRKKTVWTKRARADSSYGGFRGYLESVYTYAGTYSLSREMKRVAPDDMRIGDVFIQGGFPGHAVIVVDMAEDPKSGARKFLLAQSFMPAQEMHVLVGPGGGDPWYPLRFGDKLLTPEWTFTKTDLKRFRF